MPLRGGVGYYLCGRDLLCWGRRRISDHNGREQIGCCLVSAVTPHGNDHAANNVSKQLGQLGILKSKRQKLFTFAARPISSTANHINSPSLQCLFTGLYNLAADDVSERKMQDYREIDRVRKAPVAVSSLAKRLLAVPNHDWNTGSLTSWNTWLVIADP